MSAVATRLTESCRSAFLLIPGIPLTPKGGRSPVELLRHKADSLKAGTLGNVGRVTDAAVRCLNAARDRYRAPVPSKLSQCREHNVFIFRKAKRLIGEAEST